MSIAPCEDNVSSSHPRLTPTVGMLRQYFPCGLGRRENIYFEEPPFPACDATSHSHLATEYLDRGIVNELRFTTSHLLNVNLGGHDGITVDSPLFLGTEPILVY